MVKQKDLATTGKQKVLALVFALTMLSGFAIVWATAQYYDTQHVTESLYISDSDTSYGNFDYVTTYKWANETNLTTHQVGIVGTTLNSTELTPAYLGNNTWGVSIENMGAGEYTTIYIETVLILPNLNDWIIEYIVVNSTIPAEPCQFVADFLHFDEPYDVGVNGDETDPSQHTVVTLTNPAVDPMNLNDTVSLAESLRIYDISQEALDTGFVMGFHVIDDFVDGLGQFSWTWTVEIFGHRQTTTSLQSVLTWAMGGALFLNIIVIIYMTDAYDVGGFVRDIPKKRASPKSTGRKRRSKK